MRTKIIEATNGSNYGKFMLGVFDTLEMSYQSQLHGLPLLRSIGHDGRLVLVLDLQTREGAWFKIGGSVEADLEKHAIWVCPMYQFFLEWLYEQGEEKVLKLDLPAMVNLETDYFAFHGHRRPGPGIKPLEHELLKKFIEWRNKHCIPPQDAEALIEQFVNRKES